MKRIVFTGRGSAGHVTPNIALFPKLKSMGYDIQYIGSYDGIEKKLPLPDAVDCNLYTADESVTGKIEKLPDSLAEAVAIAASSEFLASVLPFDIGDFLEL